MDGRIAYKTSFHWSSPRTTVIFPHSSSETSLLLCVCMCVCMYVQMTVVQENTHTHTPTRWFSTSFANGIRFYWLMHVSHLSDLLSFT